MKKKKLLSGLLVTSMMLTMVPPAFAIEADVVPPITDNAPAEGEGAPNDTTVTEVSDATELAEAVKEGTGKIVLTNDITLTQTLTIDKPVTIDGQGHIITGTVSLQNGTVQNMTIASNTDKILTIGSGAENTIRMENVTLHYSVTERAGGSAASVSGNKADIVIDGCHFINEPQNNGQTVNAPEWSYGLYINGQANEGSITFTNNEFKGAFRTMLPSISGKVTIKDNVFTNTVYSVANGPTSGAGAEATCITTAKASANDEFVITGNVFNNAGSFYFQQTEKANVHNNTFNFDTFEHCIEVNIAAAHPLDLANNTFVMGSNNLVIVDKTVAPVKLPMGQRAVSYYPWAQTPEAIRPADYSTYGYAYNADGTMSFYPGSEGALQAFINPAAGNIGIQNGDTVTLTDNIDLKNTIEITGDKSLTLDLNGKTLSSAASALIKNDGTGTLTITGNGTMDNSSSTSDEAVCVWARTGDVVIENGTFINKSNKEATVYAGTSASDTAPVVTIKGGTYKNLAEGSYAYNAALKPLTLNVQNSKPVKSIVVSGGSFIGNDPSKGDDNLQGTFVADGAIVRKEGTSFTVVPKSGLTDGVYTSDPSGFTAKNYYVTDNKDGTWTVYYSAPSTGGGSSSGNKTETTVNPDGSTTTTVTRPNGSKTETTQYPDGSKEVVDTKKDGTVTTTLTDKDGNKTETVEKTDGSSTTTITKTDGSTSTTTMSKDGSTNTTVSLPSDVIEDAKGDTIPLPMPALTASKEADKAPTVTVDLPNKQRAKVEVPVKDVTAGTVAILVKEDGTEEIIKTTIQSENGVIVTLNDGDTIKIVDNSKDFVDVADDFWASETIDFVTSRGLFGGTSDTTFSPNMAMTRAMIVTVLARLDGADTSGGDVWYEKGREWAMENGISDGNNMMDSLTREQLVTMLWRYAGCPNSSHSLAGYKDAAAISDFAKDAFTWAVEEGLISGTDVTTLSPQGTATRAQVAAILARFCTNMAA